MTSNTLYFGDNLKVLRSWPDECVDLIYLDPPFNSKRDYNMVFRDAAGVDDTAQVRAFEDTWTFDGAEADYHHVVTTHERLSHVLEALKLAFGHERSMLGLVGYLAVMSARLIELRRILKPAGSLYLHCDPTASHYLKIVLDAVFGYHRQRNEVVWLRTAPKGHAFTRFASSHDVLLAYSASEETTWNASFQPHRAEYVRSHYTGVDPESGRRFMLDNCLNPNRDRPNLTYEWRGQTRVWRWTRERMEELDAAGRLVYTKNGLPRYKRYLDEMRGTPTPDVWTDIPPINSQAAERLGYPTQKPLALLERIIAASSNPGDIVCDPFCGCGTAVVAAHKLGRRWVGIDITTLATATIRKRLAESFPNDFPTPDSLRVEGFPEDLAGARALALTPKTGRHDFQNWALSLIPTARPRGGSPKKGADQGVDGVWLWLDGAGATQRGIISIKSGHVSAAQVRDLVGTLTRDKAAMGLFVTLEPPTAPMLDEAAKQGRYQLEGTTKSFPRLQILTVEDLLAGRLPDLPSVNTIEGFKAAQPIAKDQQQTLDLGDD